MAAYRHVTSAEPALAERASSSRNHCDGSSIQASAPCRVARAGDGARARCCTPPRERVARTRGRADGSVATFAESSATRRARPATRRSAAATGQPCSERWPPASLARPTRFVLDPSSAPAVRQRILHTLARVPHRTRLQRAERIARRHVRSARLPGRPVRPQRAHRLARGSGPRTSGAPQVLRRRPVSRPAVGDHKIIWELNRHQHWLPLGRAAWLTGDARYAQAIRAQLDDWLAGNPPLVGINWASMLEIGFRSISWTWALHCLLGMRHQVGTDVPGSSTCSSRSIGSSRMSSGTSRTTSAPTRISPAKRWRCTSSARRCRSWQEPAAGRTPDAASCSTRSIGRS